MSKCNSTRPVRAAVLDFVLSVCPLAEDDPDPVRWARRFVEAGRANGRQDLPAC
jgi:hypothetical protein